MAWSHWAKGLASTSILGLLVAPLAASSCAEAEGRFYVECALSGAAEECGCGETTGLAGGSFNRSACDFNSDGISRGVCGYSTTFVLKNNMISSLDIEANNNEVETSRITIYAYDLTIESDGGSFENVQGGTLLSTVEPNSGSTCIGLPIFAGDPGGAGGEPINAIATIKFYGRTTGGLEVETPEQFFSFVVYDGPTECCCEEGEPACTQGETADFPGWNGTPVFCDPVDCQM